MSDIFLQTDKKSNENYPSFLKRPLANNIDLDNARVPHFVADMMLKKNHVQEAVASSRNPLQKIVSSNQMKSSDHYWNAKLLRPQSSEYGDHLE